MTVLRENAAPVPTFVDQILKFKIADSNGIEAQRQFILQRNRSQPLSREESQQGETIEQEKLTPANKHRCVGVKYSFLQYLSPHNSILITCTLQTHQYQSRSMLLSRNLMPVQIEHSPLRRQVCHQFNQQNTSSKTIGSYLINPDTGCIGFKLPSQRTEVQLKRMTESAEKLSIAILEHIRLQRYYTKRISERIACIQAGNDSKSSDAGSAFSELYPILDQSLDFNEFDSNPQRLRDDELVNKRIKASQQLYKHKCSILRRANREAALKAINCCFGTAVRKKEEDPIKYKMDLQKSDLMSKYGRYLKKDEEVGEPAKKGELMRRIKVRSLTNDEKWEMVPHHGSYELWKNKVEFEYTEKRQIPHSESKILLLKAPKQGDEYSTKLIIRERSIINVLQGTMCVQLPQYYLAKEGIADIKDRKMYYNSVLMMECNQQRTLDDELNNNGFVVTQLTRLGKIVQIAKAIQFMKNIHMVNFGLTPWNILVQKRIRVAEFGMAYLAITSLTIELRSFLDPKSDMERHCPEPNPYSPPEVAKNQLNYRQHGHKYDIYSLGLLILNIMFKVDIASISSHRQKVRAVNHERFYNSMSREVADMLYCLAERCLAIDPMQRPNIDWALILLMKLHESLRQPKIP